jgi:RNA polymerase sigma-70 factor (ECF subfamily)
MSVEDSKFFENIKKSDPAVLEQLVRQYTGILFKACLGLGFKDFEADDLLQSVWLTFFDVLQNFEGRSSIRTFLFGILYNKASEFRKQSKKAEATENIEEVIDTHFNKMGGWKMIHRPIDPERFLETTRLGHLINTCIELLPINQKMAFLLKEVEGEKTESICEILNVGTSNLNVLLYRARNQLRECIEKKTKR